MSRFLYYNHDNVNGDVNGDVSPDNHGRSIMQDRKKLADLNWGWISGMALGLGATVGVAWSSWSLFIVVTVMVAAWMIWRAQRS